MPAVTAAHAVYIFVYSFHSVHIVNTVEIVFIFAYSITALTVAYSIFR